MSARMPVFTAEIAENAEKGKKDSRVQSTPAES